MGPPITHDDAAPLRMMAERIVRGLARGPDAAARQVAALLPGHSERGTAERLRRAYNNDRTRLEEAARAAWASRKAAFLAAPLGSLRLAIAGLGRLGVTPTEALTLLAEAAPQIIAPAVAGGIPPDDAADHAQRWAVLLPPEGHTLLPQRDPRRVRAAADLRQLAAIAAHYADLLEAAGPAGWPIAWPAPLADDAEQVLAAARQHVRRRPRSD